MKNLRKLLAITALLIQFGCGGGGSGGGDTGSSAPVPEPATTVPATYSVSIIAIEASDNVTGQSVAVSGFPVQGNTATVQ